jgi:hypothetical protein
MQFRLWNGRDELGEIFDVVGQAVGIVLRLVGKAAAEMVGCEDAEFFRERFDDVAIQERPRGIAVNANDSGVGVARAFVNVVKTARGSLEPVRRERVKGAQVRR